MYQVVPNFDITGKWINVGTDTYGQAQEGEIITFDPGAEYILSCTSLMGDSVEFRVYTLDNNNIEIEFCGGVLELTRVE